MDEYRFRVDFLEEAKEFLNDQSEKQERKSSITFGKLVVSTTTNCLKSFKTKFGNLGQSTAEHIIGYLLFGTKQITLTQW